MNEAGAFLKLSIRLIFSIYVLTVLSFWIFIRVISPEGLSELVKGINVPTLLEIYAEIYKTQNVPEDSLVHKYAAVVFLLLLFVVYLNFHTLSSWFKGFLKDRPASVESNPNSIGNIWFTGFFVLLVLLIKEFIEPFYFTQDDNHAQFLPKILVGMGLLFQGDFPFIDNFQHFGSQLFEIGTYALLDPVMIVSYAVCNYVFTQPSATLELYAAASIFIGAISLGYAFRTLKIDSLLSFSAIVCFLLCGYFLIVIRSWYYVVGIACYLPILFYFFTYALYNRCGWFWFLSTGLLRASFFYAGNAQYFVYTLLIEATAYAFVALSRKRVTLLVPYFCSILLTVGVAFPLALSQYEVQKEIARFIEPVIFGAGIPLDAIISTFLPHPFSWTVHPNNWGNQDTHFMHNMFHIGFIWVFTFIAGVIGFMRANAGKYKPLLILGTVLFFLCAGMVSLIYPLKHYIPLLNKMHMAFKWFPFAVFVIIIYSILVLNDLREYAPLRKAVFYLTTFSVIISILIAIFGTSTSFYTYGERPYPSLNKGILTHINKNEDILFGLAPMRYGSKPYTTALQHNYGCLYDIKVSNFYDPLLPTKIKDFPENLDEYFSKYGITKTVLLKTKGKVDWEYPDQDEHIARLNRYPVIYQDDDIILYNTNQPPWILRAAGDSGMEPTPRILEYDRTKIRVEINSTGISRWEYHNEYKKGYFIKINEQRGEITSSPEGWCIFELPAGKSLIEIRYMPPVFWKGVAIGLFASLLAIFAFQFTRKRIAPVK